MGTHSGKVALPFSSLLAFLLGVIIRLNKNRYRKEIVFEEEIPLRVDSFIVEGGGEGGGGLF